LAGLAGQFVLRGQGLSLVLLKATGDDKKLINQVIKLPDILSNVFHGKLPGGLEVETLAEHVLYNILVCHHAHVVAGSAELSVDGFAYRLE